MKAMLANARAAWPYVLALVCITGMCASATGNIDPTNKYAWAENAGWVNFAPSNGGVEVYFNGEGGYLAGYAWSESVGWIKLGDGTGPYGNTSASDWGVNMAKNSNLTGYAWGQNIGWIKFNPSTSQVVIDQDNGQFQGEAWGENVGWIRFKGVSPAYNVRTMEFAKHPLGTPDWWLTMHGVSETYDEGDGRPAWQEYIADTDPDSASSYFRIVALTNDVTRRAYFQSSSNRWYTLRWRNDFQTGGWSNISDQADIRGVGGYDSLRDTNTVAARFYQVGVKVP